MDDPKQLLGEQDPLPKPLAGTLSLFDINILPDRFRRRKFRLVNALPWLVLIVLLGTLYPATISTFQAQAEFRLKQIEFTDLQSTLTNYQIAAVEMENIQAEIESQIEIRDQIEASYQGIDLQGTYWSHLLFQIDQTTPAGISWTQITQVEDQIRLEGIASTYPTILILQDSLAEINGILSVQIESVDQVLDEADGPTLVETDGTSEGNLNQTRPYLFSLLVIVKEGGLQ